MPSRSRAAEIAAVGSSRSRFKTACSVTTLLSSAVVQDGGALIGEDCSTRCDPARAGRDGQQKLDGLRSGAQVSGMPSSNEGERFRDAAARQQDSSYEHGSAPRQGRCRFVPAKRQSVANIVEAR
jgi:hypothetical protein